MALIPFGEWAPDRPDFANTGITAKNVIPSPDGYRPFPDLTTVTDALTAQCLGATGVKDSNGNVYFYAGDSAKLYEGTNNAFTDQSKTGGYSTASGDVWEFVQFNSNVIATNYTDPIQSLPIGTGSSANFADHITTSTLTPKAKHMDVVGNFLVLGNTVDATDGTVTNRVWWSAIGDSTDFDPDATTQCDFDDRPKGGQIQKIVGGREYGVIIQESQICRMDYAGLPTIFDIHAVNESRGTNVPGSITAHGRLIFGLSEEGFFEFNGSETIPIGDEKVDRTFWDQFDINNKASVFSAIDPINKLVAWSFPGTGSTGGNSNKIWVYHWPTRRWGEIVMDTEIITKSLTQGYTLDGLDAVGTDIDNSTIFSESFDSDVWKGGQLRFAAFNTSHKLSYFTGSNLSATIDTGDAQLFGGRRSLVTEAWPLVDGGTTTITPGGRNRTVDSNTFGSAASQNSVGFCPLRSEYRYHRFRASITGSWSHAQGIEITGKPRGKK